MSDLREFAWVVWLACWEAEAGDEDAFVRWWDSDGKIHAASSSVPAAPSEPLMREQSGKVPTYEPFPDGPPENWPTEYVSLADYEALRPSVPTAPEDALREALAERDDAIRSRDTFKGWNSAAERERDESNRQRAASEEREAQLRDQRDEAMNFLRRLIDPDEPEGPIEREAVKFLAAAAASTDTPNK